MIKLRFRTLLARLLAAYLLPGLALFVLFGLLAYRVTERSLEQSLGRRLIGVAQATTTIVNPDVVAFLAPGDDESRSARRLRHKLETMGKRTDVADIILLDTQLRAVLGTGPEVRIGDRYYQAESDRSELESVFKGQTASSVLFRGVDRRFYKTGYAPIRGESGVVGAVGVRGSAQYFAALASLRNTLVGAGIAVFALLVALSVLTARRTTRPLRRLASAARRIGAGQLNEPVAVESTDEVGLLASTMNDMRHALLERDQQMQMMLSGIAHEVRNPLGGIALFAGLLREELADQPDRLAMVQRIEREMDYLKRVVTEFLDYARQRPLQGSPVDLAVLVDDVAQVLRGDAEAAGVSLSCSVQPACIDGDSEQLRRVMLNLARNAIQACGPEGLVQLRCGTAAGSAYFEMVDDGHGIADEALRRVFDPFFTTRERGTGLGLALSRQIIEQHGGKLTLESKPDHGTRARATLPSPKGLIPQITGPLEIP